VQRALAAHVLRGELAAQPLRARSRKQLDKCWNGLTGPAAKRFAHSPF
jgi:hypothetical protein